MNVISLKFPEEFIYEVKRVVTNETEKNIVLNTFRKHFGINHALTFTHNLLEGKVTDVTNIPAPYLIQVAENLKIDPTLYFEKNKDIDLAEVFQRLDYNEKERRKMKVELDNLEKKVSDLEKKVGK